MTALAWVAWAVIFVAIAVVAWSVWADRRDYTDLRADLDELAGDYPTPAARIAALENYTAELSAYTQELEDQRPASGRHAHTGATRAAA